jgi:hypothetical protein
MALLNGQVYNPFASAQVDGSEPRLPQGRRAEMLVSEIMGKYANLTERGVVFQGSTLAAGTIIPINAASLVSTFTLWNPLGSGVKLHVLDYDLGLITTTAVVGSLLLHYQSGVGAGILAPTSQTALVPVNALIGSGVTPQAKLLSAGTLTGTPTILAPLGISFGTVAGNPGPTPPPHIDFDGKLILAPGTLVTVTSTAAQTAAMVQKLSWAELPA